MSDLLKRIPRIMDVLGALLFLMLFVYFVQKENKNHLEFVLMFLVGIGLLFDVAFVAMYLNGV